MHFVRLASAVALPCLLLSVAGRAQQHDTSAAMPGMKMPPSTTVGPAKTAMPMAPGDSTTIGMSMAGPLGISMERLGSGTTWIPDDVRLPSRHFMLGSWGVMLHGFVFGQYDYQAAPRGTDQWGSLNWAMAMAERDVAGGRLQFRFMPSMDAASVGKCGYPLLLQSGETCNGQLLHDRQHPHDFFMELAALYQRAVSSCTALEFYVAPAGEPALGPVAFMHRPSAMDMPFAPIGHHWQDATHISYGVGTLGVYTRTMRVEASAFNGFEPDENRWNFDPIRINSYSGRLTLNPNTRWSFTAGYGGIADASGGMLHRIVTSAMYGRTLAADGQWAMTLLLGANKEDKWSSSALVESDAVLDRNNTVFSRAELVQKSAGDLVLPAFPPERLFTVGTVSAGYIRELRRGREVTVGLGASGAVNLVPRAIESDYGSRAPLGATVFVRLRPYHTPHTSAMNDMTQRHVH
jgi:hypothetical protein